MQNETSKRQKKATSRNTTKNRLANYTSQAVKLLVAWQKLQAERNKRNKTNYLIELKKLLILTSIEMAIDGKGIPDELPNIENFIQSLINKSQQMERFKIIVCKCEKCKMVKAKRKNRKVRKVLSRLLSKRIRQAKESKYITFSWA